ncbi:antibiotic biosynthesis monooxygenase [Nocardioides campestrisoli]|uniref:antibiotic biosynthesis monooxygenase n=1 Tax=Nocardioides campestrisoli TaxID=2736757 RepID=UPI001C62FAAC|nr:antibiotic biosynthesis monooxygenase [Nocardioides campestrisoli]
MSTPSAAPVTGPVAGPVTVAVTRHVAPDHEAEMHAWLQAGDSLAQRFPGFLGSGWVRPSPGSTEWHMLYRFADAASLEAWESSPQRRWWLDAAAGKVEQSRVERRTGIEGWFDEPASTEVAGEQPPPPAPPRWKQMVVIFLVFFPLSLCTNWAASHLIPDWPLVPRVLVIISVMTPLMTYVFMPWATRKMQWFLQPERDSQR